MIEWALERFLSWALKAVGYVPEMSDETDWQPIGRFKG
jgi:hypothetical protein